MHSITTDSHAHQLARAAAVDASAHICGDDVNKDNALAIAVSTGVAESTARAAATAVANVAAECYASAPPPPQPHVHEWQHMHVTHRHRIQNTGAGGQASFKINGRSAASAEAYAYAEAFASAVTEASVCGKCSAAAEFVAESWEEIFLRAVAESEIYLSESANGGTITRHKHDFVENVHDVTVTAFAAVRPLQNQRFPVCTCLCNASEFPTPQLSVVAGI